MKTIINIKTDHQTHENMKNVTYLKVEDTNVKDTVLLSIGMKDFIKKTGNSKVLKVGLVKVNELKRLAKSLP